MAHKTSNQQMMNLRPNSEKIPVTIFSFTFTFTVFARKITLEFFLKPEN